jgi:ABC-type nitrate/sulfonate/bicarbonate transport system substrate-binding protein
MTKLNGALHLVSSTFSAITIGLFLCGGPATAQDVVRIGVGVDPSFTTWWVAKDRDFFKRYNINAEITQFSGGPELADSTMAGEMDFGSSGTATWMPRFVRADALLIVGKWPRQPTTSKWLR